MKGETPPGGLPRGLPPPQGETQGETPQVVSQWETQGETPQVVSQGDPHGGDPPPSGLPGETPPQVVSQGGDSPLEPQGDSPPGELKSMRRHLMRDPHEGDPNVASVLEVAETSIFLFFTSFAWNFRVCPQKD